MASNIFETLGRIAGGLTAAGAPQAIQVLADGTVVVSGTFSASLSGFTPNGGSAAAAVTSASTSTALPANGGSITVTNVGTKTAYLTTSSGAGAATTNATPVYAGQTLGFGTQSGVDHLNAICGGADSTTLNVQGGSGLFAGATQAGAGGGGGGGAVTVADGADVAEGATTDAAVVGDVSGTLSAKLRGLSKIWNDLWDSVNHRIRVDGSGVTQPVSAASLPLPAGAATAAKQPALGTAGAAAADVITVQGITSMTPVKVDGSGVTQPVSIAATVLTQGAAAAWASVSGNPLLNGGRASSTGPTAVSDGQAVAQRLDVLGDAVSVLNAPRALKGVATLSTTDALSHTLIAAGAAGVFNDVEALIITNSSATGVTVTISDGTNSHVFYAPPTDTRGISIPTMLPAASAATAWTAQASSGVSTITISATYAKRLA